MVVLGGVALSYERGTPVTPLPTVLRAVQDLGRTVLLGRHGACCLRPHLLPRDIEVVGGMGFGFRALGSQQGCSCAPQSRPTHPSPLAHAAALAPPGVGYRVTEFGFRIPGFGFRFSCFVSRISCFGFRVSGDGTV